MATQPPMHELQFLKICQNHGELSNKMTQLGAPAPVVLEYAKHICVCWFQLSAEHLEDAQASLASGKKRTVFSRSYYAAYNASKAVRYVYKGFVSLKGDDHNLVGSLPTDFPDAADWAETISTLYQHRLRADYDNWSDTEALQNMVPGDAVGKAAAFIEVAKEYMLSKYGVAL